MSHEILKQALEDSLQIKIGGVIIETKQGKHGCELVLAIFNCRFQTLAVVGLAPEIPVRGMRLADILKAYQIPHVIKIRDVVFLKAAEPRRRGAKYSSFVPLGECYVPRRVM